MATKPIKSLELHYTMIQFLINRYSPHKLKINGENESLSCNMDIVICSPFHFDTDYHKCNIVQQNACGKKTAIIIIIENDVLFSK